MRAIARKAIRYAANASKALVWGWNNKNQSMPVYAVGTSAGLRLHLGSGPINLQGWVNIDARHYPHVHLISEGFELREFADGMAAEIYFCHVLEHFSFDESLALLKGLGKKLAPGGVLRLSVPSFDRLIDVYRESGNNLELIKFAMMGGQDYEYNFHKSLYNFESISRILVEAGYVNVVEWKTLEDFGRDLGDRSEERRVGKECA
jgi:predicted SAM-dependent methyltransferase